MGINATAIRRDLLMEYRPPVSEYSVQVEEALARLVVKPDYDCGRGPEPCVHTFVQDYEETLVGAHWPLTSVRAAMERYGVEEAGPDAGGLGHPLVITRFEGAGPVFLEAWPGPAESR